VAWPALSGGSWTEVAAFGHVDVDVVDAGFTPPHQTAVVEFPQLIAVAPVPLAGDIVPFVLEPDSDAVLPEAPEALA
jgi:hypothetical protein